MFVSHEFRNQTPSVKSKQQKWLAPAYAHLQDYTRVSWLSLSLTLSSSWMLFAVAAERVNEGNFQLPPLRRLISHSANLHLAAAERCLLINRKARLLCIFIHSLQPDLPRNAKNKAGESAQTTINNEKRAAWRHTFTVCWCIRRTRTNPPTRTARFLCARERRSVW